MFALVGSASGDALGLFSCFVGLGKVVVGLLAFFRLPLEALAGGFPPAEGVRMGSGLLSGSMYPSSLVHIRVRESVFCPTPASVAGKVLFQELCYCVVFRGMSMYIHEADLATGF